MDKAKKAPSILVLLLSRISFSLSFFFMLFFAILGTVGIFQTEKEYTLVCIFYSLFLFFLYRFVSHYLKIIYAYKQDVKTKATVYKVVSAHSGRISNYRQRTLFLYYKYTFQGREYKSHSSIHAMQDDVPSYDDKKMLILIHPKKPTFTILLASIEQANGFFMVLKTLFWPFNKKDE